MKRSLLIILIISLAIAGIVSYFASQYPDGLERVAVDLGFVHKAKDPAVTVLPDYTIPGIEGIISNGLAGIIGVLATFGFVLLIGKLIIRRN